MEDNINRHYIRFYLPGHYLGGEKAEIMTSFGPFNSAIPIDVGHLVSAVPNHPGAFKVIQIEHTLSSQSKKYRSVLERTYTRHDMHCYTIAVDDIEGELEEAAEHHGFVLDEEG